MVSERPAIPEGDLRLLERLADRVVALRLEVPALVTLESAKPVSLVASQAMVFFQPFVAAVFPVAGYERFARIMENRENVERLARLIEDRADRRDHPRGSGGPARGTP
jgi:hypothetical protein